MSEHPEYTHGVLSFAELKELGAWMREAGIAKLALPSGIVLELGAPPLGNVRDTLKEQAENAEKKRRYDEAMMFAATEGLPAGDGDFGKFE